MKATHLRTLRLRQHLTQTGLEKKSKVAQNTISKLESNRHARPNFKTVAALAHALGVHPLAIKFGPDPKRPDRTRRRGQNAAWEARA